MFGYACRETPELMPAPIYYSHKILELMAAARHKGEGDAGKLGPDAKSQVTIRYENGKPSEVTSIVVSTQHLDPSWDSAKVRSVVEPYVREALSDLPIASDCNWYINPTGKFVIGGPDGDAGLTGRKIIVDTYGGAAPHGGGAFSGKDTTKVDRSAAYAARYLAKNASPPAKLPTAAPSSFPMPSAWRSRCRSMSIPTAPARCTRRCWRMPFARSWTCRRLAFAVIST
jgi:S-adenosylmethionine synthetase